MKLLGARRLKRGTGFKGFGRLAELVADECFDGRDAGFHGAQSFADAVDEYAARAAPFAAVAQRDSLLDAWILSAGNTQ